MGEMISFAEKIAARAKRTANVERSVVIVQGACLRESTSLARDLAALSGGQVVLIRPRLKATAPPSEESNSCSSCTLQEDIEDYLFSLTRKTPAGKGPIWLVAPVAADPWSIADTFGPENRLHQAGFRIRSVISAIRADRLLLDWTSIRRIGHNREISMVEAIADQIDFSDALVLSGSDEERKTGYEFLRRLNSRTEILGRSELTMEWARGLTFRNFSAEATANGAVWRLALKASNEPTPGQVFRSPRPLHPERFFELVRRWPEELLRSEGIAWIASEPDLAFTITQAGPRLFDCSGNGQWLATLSGDELKQAREDHPEAFEYWNPTTGDRMTELAFAWESPSARETRSPAFFQELQHCLLSDFEMRLDWTRFRDPFREEREKEWARLEKRRARRPYFKPLHVVGHHTGEPINGNPQEKDL